MRYARLDLIVRHAFPAIGRFHIVLLLEAPFVYERVRCRVWGLDLSGAGKGDTQSQSVKNRLQSDPTNDTPERKHQRTPTTSHTPTNSRLSVGCHFP